MRLLEAIRDPTIRPLVGGLSAHTMQALADLSRLDESLYERFMEGGGRVDDEAAPEAVLNRLSNVTFRGVRALLVFLDRLKPADPASLPPGGPESADIDFGLDSVTTQAAEPVEDEDDAGFDFGDIDIEGALDTIVETEDRDDAARWSELRDKLEAIAYGLKSQLADLDERFKEGLAGGHVAQVLECLDDTRNSVGEGLFAVLTAIYEVFLPKVDASSVAPGYLSALARALLVRRGLADLTRVVDPANATLQSEKSTKPAQEAAFKKLRETVHAFVEGPVFRGMRPADRWEILKFDRAVAQQTMNEAKLGCEGLAKYLESLSSINQREVLQVHDEKVTHELREALSAARPLLSLNLGVATEMVKQALALAQRLYGRSRANDELLSALTDAAPALTTEGEVEAVLSTLELLLDDGG